jgi:hypothetical protein
VKAALAGASLYSGTGSATGGGGGGDERYAYDTPIRRAMTTAAAAMGARSEPGRRRIEIRGWFAAALSERVSETIE